MAESVCALPLIGFINGLFGADLEQGIAGDGIERLEAAVHEDGQLAEGARI